MPVSFEELVGSPTVSVDIISGEATGTRSFKIAWANYGQFVYDLCGQWVNVGGTTTFVPASINFPGWPQLIVNTIAIKPFMSEAPTAQTFSSLTSATNSYTDAQVDVTYKPRQQYQNSGTGHHPGVPNIPNGTILEVSSKTAHEFLTVPGTSLKWDTDSKNLPADVNAGIRIATNSFSLRWSRVPAPPWSAMRTAEGCTNDSSFLGYSAGCVLFEGSDRNASFQISGSDLWTITYNFKSRSQPWEKAYRSDGFASGWIQVDNFDGDPLFLQTSFTPLFSFGS